jgi:nitrogen PTS system EIIA component
MELTIKEVATLLDTSEKTIEQWIENRKLPAYKINRNYRFNKSELHAWIIENQVPVSEKILDLNITKRPVNMFKLIQQGTVINNLAGSSIQEVLTAAVEHIPLPAELDQMDILWALLQREELMTTAIGMGIAIPHPRNPVITDIDNESVTICFLKNPIDFHAMDGQPVHTLFIILSANVSHHLEILSKISFFCQQEAFTEMLKNRATEKEILKYISAKEEEWNK